MGLSIIIRVFDKIINTETRLIVICRININGRGFED